MVADSVHPEPPASEDEPAPAVLPTLVVGRSGRKPALKVNTGGVPRELPVRLGKYLIDALIGQGAMGVVYRARQEGLDRVVALKILPHGAHASEASRHRFEREAQAIAKLRHPNIVSIHEVGEYDGQPFFTMDYIDGTPLDVFLKTTGITSTVVIAELCATICDAVQYAHDQGIVHRDLKPGNILVDRTGRPIVTDFGLAKDLDADSLLSMPGDIVGTPAFMSPEQAEGRVEGTGFASDVYSLGAILYTMLTRKPPFEGKTLVETLGQVINREPKPLTHANPAIEGELGAICLKAMEKDPYLRYETAQAMANDLRAFINGFPVSARPWTWRRGVAKFCGRHRGELTGLGVAAVLLALVGYLATQVFSQTYLDIARAHLNSGDATVRAEAVGTLAREIRQPDQLHPDRLEEAARLLLGAADDDETGVQAALLAALDAGSPPDALQREMTQEQAAWVMALADRDDDPQLRNLAIAVMARFRRGDFAEYLLARLDEPNPAVRLRVVRSLGHQATRRALGPLLNMRVYDPICRAEAEIALERFYQEGRIALFEGQDSVVKDTLRTLGDAMAQYNQQLEAMSAAADPQSPPPGMEGPLAAYAQALSSGSPMEQQQAIYELGQTGDPRAAELLLDALHDRQFGDQAAYALSRVHAGRFTRQLVEKLKDPAPHTRAHAALALGLSRQTSAVDEIVVALQVEGDLSAGSTMIQALAELGSPDAIPALRQVAERDQRLKPDVDASLQRLGAGD